MNRGKETCNVLKQIRQQIAEKNDIPYSTTECHFEGECRGTCPKCDAELRYLEDEVKKRGALKKVASIAGISLGVAMAFSSCIIEGDPVDIEGDPMPPDDCVTDTIANKSLEQNVFYIDQTEDINQNKQ